MTHTTEAGARPGLKALALRAVLVLAGGLIALTGINVGLGGIETLGLQGAHDFFAVTDKAMFQAQDSHVRFLGGLWLGVALVFVAAAVRLKVFRVSLLACIGLIVVGGLARFSVLDPAVVFGPAVVGSLAAELVVMPLLAVWVWRTRT